MTIGPLLLAVGLIGGVVGVADRVGSTSPPPSSEPSSTGCIVRLHGKSGTGGPATVTDGFADLAPTGNADGWGGRQWVYFPEDRYQEIVDELTSTVESAGCARVVVDGFSNGAALAGKLFCHGETLGGVVIGVVIDDPVPDHGVDDCEPDPNVRGALYWTGALADASAPGTSCEPMDWTCEGGETIGIDQYAESLGLAVQPSPHTEHEWFRNAPEILEWLSGERAPTTTT